MTWAKTTSQDKKLAVALKSLPAIFCKRPLSIRRMYDQAGTTASQKDTAQFAQYAHLAALENLIKNNPELEAALGGNYIVKPVIVVKRWPMSDQDLNQQGAELDDQAPIACHTPLRQRNYDSVRPLLHASISCKWTLRSDRAQNTRTEAHYLIRHRTGALPHVVAVTAEPLPTRLATLALGTGDIDCTYHFALPEL